METQIKEKPVKELLEDALNIDSYLFTAGIKIGLKYVKKIDNDGKFYRRRELKGTVFLALLELIKKYDPEKAQYGINSLIAHLRLIICRMILDDFSLLKNSSRSVIIRKAYGLEKKIQKFKLEYKNKYGYSANEDEIVKEFKFTEEKLRIHKDIVNTEMLSLDIITYTDNKSQPLKFSEIVADPKNNASNFFKKYYREEVIQLVNNFVFTDPRITEQQRIFFDLYYYHDYDYYKIGEVLGVSESRICQISKRFTRFLNDFLEEKNISKENIISKQLFDASHSKRFISSF